MVHNNTTSSAVTSTIVEQLMRQHDIAHSEQLPRKPRAILVCGMGGSGMVGNLLPFHVGIPVTKHTSYGLPKHIPEGTLVLVVSYSGTTRETLTMFAEAQARKLPLAVITGGGALKTQAQESAVPHSIVPWSGDVPTRYAIGDLVRSALAILAACGASPEMPAKHLTPAIDKTEGEAHTIAELIHTNDIVVYAPHTFSGIASVWKVFLNETAKVPVLAGYVPEVTHNEIEALASLDTPSLVLLEDPHARTELRAHTKALRSLAREQQWQVTDIPLTGEHRIHKAWYAVALARSTADTLANLRGVDPHATPRINTLKQML